MSRLSFLILTSALAIPGLIQGSEPDEARIHLTTELGAGRRVGVAPAPDFGVSATVSIAAVDPESGVRGAAVATQDQNGTPRPALEVWRNHFALPFADQ